MTGLFVLAACLVIATALGGLWRWRQGRVRDLAEDRRVLTADQVGRLGDTATLVQFSSDWCAPCRVTSRLLEEVAQTHPGITHIDLDAASHLDLVRELGVLRTPTTLVLDRGGAIVHSVSGTPRVTDLTDAIRRLPAGSPSRS
jgi:thiol-disulfide isomerase/thioredoxin